MSKTLKIIKIGKHSVGIKLPKSIHVLTGEAPYQIKNGHLDINLTNLINAKRQAMFVKQAFSDMTPVSNQTMKRKFHGWNN